MPVRSCHTAIVPRAPRQVNVTANGTVSFLLPTGMGDSLIRNYTVVAVPLGGNISDPNTVNVTGWAPPLRLSGLVDGAEYEVSVLAQNGAGYSAPSKPFSLVADTLPVRN